MRHVSRAPRRATADGCIRRPERALHRSRTRPTRTRSSRTVSSSRWCAPQRVSQSAACHRSPPRLARSGRRRAVPPSPPSPRRPRRRWACPRAASRTYPRRSCAISTSSGARRSSLTPAPSGETSALAERRRASHVHVSCVACSRAPRLHPDCSPLYHRRMHPPSTRISSSQSHPNCIPLSHRRMHPSSTPITSKLSSTVTASPSPALTNCLRGSTRTPTARYLHRTYLL